MSLDRRCMSSFIFCSTPSVSRWSDAVRLRSVMLSLRDLTCDPVLSSLSAAVKRYASCCERERGAPPPTVSVTSLVARLDHTTDDAHSRAPAD